MMGAAGNIAGSTLVDRIDQRWSNITNDMLNSSRTAIGVGTNPLPLSKERGEICSSLSRLPSDEQKNFRFLFFAWKLHLSKALWL